MNDKILIIDDEKEITELIEAFLKNESFAISAIEIFLFLLGY